MKNLVQSALYILIVLILSCALPAQAQETIVVGRGFRLWNEWKKPEIKQVYPNWKTHDGSGYWDLVCKANAVPCTREYWNSKIQVGRSLILPPISRVDPELEETIPNADSSLTQSQELQDTTQSTENKEGAPEENRFWRWISLILILCVIILALGLIATFSMLRKTRQENRELRENTEKIEKNVLRLQHLEVLSKEVQLPGNVFSHGEKTILLPKGRLGKIWLIGEELEADDARNKILTDTSHDIWKVREKAGISHPGRSLPSQSWPHPDKDEIQPQSEVRDIESSKTEEASNEEVAQPKARRITSDELERRQRERQERNRGREFLE